MIQLSGIVERYYLLKQILAAQNDFMCNETVD